MPFEFVDHTADVAFEASGRSLEELFSACADALLNTMVNSLDSVENRLCRPVELHHEEIDMLLFNFLQELIFLKDAEGLLLRPSKLKIHRKDGVGYALEGQFEGEMLSPDRHEQRADVKAVTLHRFSVRRVGWGWLAHVILDV